VFTFAANCFAQSVVEVARRERERQKRARSTIVVTSIGTVTPAIPAGGLPAEAGPAPAAAPTAPKSSQPTDNKGHDEKYWRGEFQKAREESLRADARVSILDTKIKDLNTQLLQR